MSKTRTSFSSNHVLFALCRFPNCPFFSFCTNHVHMNCSRSEQISSCPNEWSECFYSIKIKIIFFSLNFVFENNNIYQKDIFDFCYCHLLTTRARKDSIDSNSSIYIIDTSHSQRKFKVFFSRIKREIFKIIVKFFF